MESPLLVPSNSKIVVQTAEPNCSFDYLANHSSAIPEIANWHFREWAPIYPEWTLEKVEVELRSHPPTPSIPTTLIALDNGRPVGSVSLLTDDLKGWEHLSPWLGSLYVLPPERGRGLGRSLVQRAVAEARAIGISNLYLFTDSQEAFYLKLGWTRVCVTVHHERQITILVAKLR